MGTTVTHIADALFRAFDLRIDALALSEPLAHRLIHANAWYFRNCLHTNQLVLCRDARLSGPRFLQQAVTEYARLGFRIIINPVPVSSCQFYYMCMRHPEAAGIMFSASHNPGRYTGQKIVGPNVLPIASGYGPDGGLDAIKRAFLRGTECEALLQSTVRYVDYVQDYIDFVMDMADLTSLDFSNMHIVCDYLHGSASREIALALARTNVNVIHRNSIPDGNFPSGDPNPGIITAIEPMIEMMREQSFDFGFCFDGDGDRIDVFTGKGNQLSPSLNYSLIAPQLQSSGDVYLDPKASFYSYVELAKKNLTPHLVKNGHSFIKAMLVKPGSDSSIGAVEESAHYYFRITQPSDPKIPIALESTLLVVLLTMKSWAIDSLQYARMMSVQKSMYRKREWAYRFETDEQRKSVLAEIEKRFAFSDAHVITSMDSGESLGGTLFRWNLPLDYNDTAELPQHWVQIAQRSSESEERIARWEVIASDRDSCFQAVDSIEEVVHSLAEKAERIG
ncbi:MAG: hypothetical protein PHR01_05490 [Sphaerochaetaceae bacterium]|nr:hypothetical protein [Sphaerochaetaceae bacterium]